MKNKKTLKNEKDDFEVSVLLSGMRMPLSEIKARLSLALDGEYGEFSFEMKNAIEKSIKANEKTISVLEKIQEKRKKLEKKKIMFFEDDKFLEEIYQKKFIEKGFEIQFFNEPSENFLEDIINFNPDLIITNVFMPKMGGLELLEEIKKDKRTKKYQVLIFSSSGGDEGIRQQAIQLGAMGCWAKSDYSPEKFIDKIKEFFEVLIYE